MDLSADAKLIYLWTFTNQACNTAGVYRIEERVIRFETALPDDRFSSAFSELQEAHFVVYRDGVLWVRTRVKHLLNKGVKTAKGIVNDLRLLDPSHPILAAFLEAYGTTGYLMDALSEFSIGIKNPGSGETGFHGYPLHGASRGMHTPSEFSILDTNPGADPREFPIVDKNSDSELSDFPLESKIPEGYPWGMDTLHNHYPFKLLGKEGVRGRKPNPLPTQLQATFEKVWPILQEVAEAKRAKLSESAVANSLSRHQDRDAAKAADEFRFWHLHGNGEDRPLRNVAQGFDNWLRKTDPDPAIAQRVDRTDERLREALQ